ncbi:MAG: AMP-binding protein [Polyangiaceae bacterium]
MSTLSVFEAAREAPQKPAIVLEGRVVNHAELAERVRARLPALAPLRDRPPHSFVSVAAPSTLASLELIHALMANEVPFLPLHERLTASERAALLERLGPAFHIDGDDERTELTPLLGVQSLPGAADGPEAPLALIMTSGTTGAPRAALLSRRAFHASARASADNLGWRADDRWLLCLPLAHIGGLSVVTRCLLARKPLVLADSWQHASSGEALLGALVDGRATLVSVVPTQLSRLLQLVPTAEPLPAPLRAILTGGAATPASLLAECSARGWPVLTSYGSSEACSQIATQSPGESPLAGGCGRPLAAVSVRIDPEGRIQLKGPTLFSGYHPGAADPFETDGWLRTQDLGRFDADGVLHVLGRADEVIISGGENVAPWEVERALESCPGVRQACVFGVVDERWGQAVAAALLLEPGTREATLARVREHVRRELAGYKAPRVVVFDPSLPREDSGKLFKRRIRDRYWAEAGRSI